MSAEVSPEARAALALALDVDDLVEALRLARLLRPWFGVAKVGLELYSAAGPEATTALAAAGFDVFVDLKLLDIPNTVHRAARVLGSLGARYVTLHARGGIDMVRAGVDGLGEGAHAAGVAAPVALGVTVLTSDAGAPPHIVPDRITLAAEGGCGGLVCAAADVGRAKALAPELAAVVPGIRPAGAPVGDQARPASPAEAIAAGADVLVVGRPVTAAVDPVAAAVAIAAEVEEAQRQLGAREPR